MPVRLLTRLLLPAFAFALAIGLFSGLQSRAQTPPAGHRVAGVGEVCRAADHLPGVPPRHVRARPCAPGLHCCNNCGIAGCDSLCQRRACGPGRP